MAYDLRNSVSDVSNNDSEVRIQSLSDFIDKYVVAFLATTWSRWSLLLLLLLLIWILSWLLVWIIRIKLLLWFLFRYYICTILKIILIIGKQVVLFRVNQCLHKVSALVSFGLQNCGNDFHDVWNDSREPHKDSVNDTLCQTL